MPAARIQDLRGPTARRNPERMPRLSRLWRPARPWARPLARRRGSQPLPRVSLPEGNSATASPFAFLLFRAFATKRTSAATNVLNDDGAKVWFHALRKRPTDGIRAEKIAVAEARDACRRHDRCR